MQFPRKNEGTLDRIIRLIVGLGLLYAGLALVQGWVGVVLIVFSLVFLTTTALGYCYLYTLLGVDTTKKQ